MERLDSVLRGLTVWWLVSVMAMVVEFLECCWGECRGFAQLREGSDDPPPGEDRSIRLGGCDAQARKHSQQDDSHRHDATQTGNQMHQTKTPSPNTKRNQHRLLSKFCLPAPTLHQIAGANGEASRLLDIPRSSPYHPVSKQHTTTAKAIEYGEAPPPAICKRTGPHP